MTILIDNNYEADIVDIETDFLYGDLEEEIHLKIPEGLDEYLEMEFERKFTICFSVLSPLGYRYLALINIV